MKFIEQKGLDPIAVLDEFDLHQILCVGRQALLMECKPETVTDGLIMDEQCGCIDGIRIEPKHPDKFTPTMIAHWERHINDLFRTIQKLDGLIHEDAEYTC